VISLPTTAFVFIEWMPLQHRTCPNAEQSSLSPRHSIKTPLCTLASNDWRCVPLATSCIAGRPPTLVSPRRQRRGVVQRKAAARLEARCVQGVVACTSIQENRGTPRALFALLPPSRRVGVVRGLASRW